MVIFVVYILCPNLIRTGKISTQSYLLFPLWSILGMVYFRRLLKLDNETNNTRFGQSTIVWVLLFSIMFSTSFTWMLDTNQKASEKLITDIEIIINKPEKCNVCCKYHTNKH